MMNIGEILLNIWNTIVNWFEIMTGWLDPLLKPHTDVLWQNSFNYFNSFTVILQFAFIALLLYILINGIITVLKKSFKLVIILGIIAFVFMVFNR